MFKLIWFNFSGKENLGTLTLGVSTSLSFFGVNEGVLLSTESYFSIIIMFIIIIKRILNINVASDSDIILPP